MEFVLSKTFAMLNAVEEMDGVEGPVSARFAAAGV
jgi:hypothetical protein